MESPKVAPDLMGRWVGLLNTGVSLKDKPHRPGRQKGNLGRRMNVGEATEPCFRTCPCAFKGLQPSLPMSSPSPRFLRLSLEKSLPVTEGMAIVGRWEPDWPRDARRLKPPPSKKRCASRTKWFGEGQ